MVRGSTPTITLTVGDETLDLGTADNVYVTFTDNPGFGAKTVVTKTGSEISVSGNVVDVWLTEEESLSLANGSAAVQVNWIYYEDGNARRGATLAKNITIFPQLLEEEIING